MKDTFPSLQDKSFVILKRLYEKVKHDTETYVSVFDLAGEDFTRDEAIQIWSFLIDEGWVKEGVKATGTPDMHITSRAIKEIESGFLSHRIPEIQNSISRVITKSKTESSFVTHQTHKNSTQMLDLEIFISHSSTDVNVAEALIELLRAALNIPPEKIRCTSVDGYRLPVGVPTDEYLRQEIFNTKAFIGIITESSIKSAYVLFELGARWGAQQHLAPVLARGADSTILAGPLKGLNTLSFQSAAQIHQLVSDISSKLAISPARPESYQKYIEALVEKSMAKSDKSVDKNPIRKARKKRSKRKRLATKKMVAEVGKDGELFIKFDGGLWQKFSLPDRNDKPAIRSVRDKAVAWAKRNGATDGQAAAVKKALTSAGYYLTK